MERFRADLHCHSTCSDGTFSPKKIIDLAIDLQLNGLSITDHDTFAAYEEAIPYANEKGFNFLSGIELSSVHKKTSVHILGYSFSLQSSALKNFCKQHQQRRTERFYKMVERLADKGKILTSEDFESFSPQSLGRPHLAYAMMKKGYVKSIQEAFQNYLGDGKPCYIAGSPFSVEETLDVIHQANGLAIIAHPHLIDKSDILRDLLSMNFDGIEGYYARFPQTKNERWLKIAAKKNWIITGGSDFHGDIKPEQPLGSSWVNEQTFNGLMDHFRKNNDLPNTP